MSTNDHSQPPESPTALDFALWLVNTHPECHVFPVGKNKRPLFKGWQDAATNDPGQIRQWAEKYPRCNMALDCGGSGLMALDVDVKNGKPVRESLLGLTLDHGELPGTFMFNTPSGGFIQVYKGAVANTVEKIAPGLDTRGPGGYVLLPGSVINGNAYKLTTNGGFADCPAWLSRLAGKPVERDPNSSVPAVDLDRPESIQAGRSYLDHQAPIAVEGLSGDGTTWAVAVKLRDLGISEPAALELMLDHYNDRCQPPWDYEDLARKVENAFRYAKGQPGSASPALFDDDLPEGELNSFSPDQDGSNTPGVDSDPAKYRLGSFILDEEPRPIAFLTGGLPIPMGCVTVLAGPGSGLKTTLAENLAIQTVTGLPMLRGIMESLAHGPVLYFAAEDPLPVIHNRLRMLMRHHKGLAEGFGGDLDWADVEERFRRDLYVMALHGREAHLARLVDGRLKTTATFKEVRSIVAKVSPVLLPIDTRSRAYPVDEISNDICAQVVANAETFADDVGCAVLLMAHTTKGSRGGRSGQDAWRDGLDATATRGGGALLDNARAGINTVRVPEPVALKRGYSGSQPLVVAKSTKNAYGPSGMEIWMHRTHEGGLAQFAPAVRPVQVFDELPGLITEAVTEKPGIWTVHAFSREQARTWKETGVCTASADRVKAEVLAMLERGDLTTEEKVNSKNRQPGFYICPAGGRK